MSGSIGDNPYRASGVVATTTVAEYDDDQIQSNIAVLGFYVAVNGSLVRYNLVDQSIDEYFDTSGVDAPASINEARSTVSPYYYYGGAAAAATEDADSTGTDGLYSWYKWTDTASTGSYEIVGTSDHEYLIVAGGGGGGRGNAGGGGAGGYRVSAAFSLIGGTTYTITVGAGGAGRTTTKDVGTVGNDSSLAGPDITDVVSSGGGYGSNDAVNAGDGGSGGGAGYGGGDAGASSPVTSPAQGHAGGTASTAGPSHGASGGGGAGAVGDAGINTAGGDGGIGVSNDIDGSATWYAGGGGGSVNSFSAEGGNVGAGANGRTQGGGGQGVGNDAGLPGGDNTVVNATANTGGGGGGAQGGGTTVYAGPGGSGIVVLRRLTSAGGSILDLTLQATDVTAESEPDYGELVMLIENAQGTATLNTDIKGYVSRDSGTNFTQGTLLDEGSWGTNKQILGFHDLDISGQPSGTSMCYKITTHNQSSGSKETRIYATSIGWK